MAKQVIDVKVIFSAVGDAALDKARATMVSLGNGAKLASVSMSTLAPAVMGVGAALGGAAAAAGQLYTMLKDAAPLVTTQERFAKLADSINTTSDALLGKLREATMGIMSDMQLMGSATQLMSLGLVKNEEQVVRLATVAGRLNWNMDQLVLTFANMSKLRLDALGLSVEEVVAKSNELKAAGMSAQDAWKEAVIQAGEARLDVMGLSQAELAIKQLETAVKNAGDQFKVSFAVEATQSLTATKDAAIDLTEVLGGIATEAGGWLGTQLSVLGLGTAIRMTKKDIEELGGSTSELQDEFNKIMAAEGISEWDQFWATGTESVEIRTKALSMLREELEKVQRQQELTAFFASEGVSNTPQTQQKVVGVYNVEGVETAAQELARLSMEAEQADQAMLNLASGTTSTRTAVGELAQAYQTTGVATGAMAGQLAAATIAAAAADIKFYSTSQTVYTMATAFEIATNKIRLAQAAFAGQIAAAEGMRNQFELFATSGSGAAAQYRQMAEQTGYTAYELAQLGKQAGMTAEELRQALVSGQAFVENGKVMETTVAGAAASFGSLGSSVSAAEAAMQRINSAFQTEISLDPSEGFIDADGLVNIERANELLYTQAAAAGASATELAMLGIATGKFSEEQAKAALKAAVLQEAISRMAKSIVSGQTSIDDAVAAVGDIKVSLDSTTDMAGIQAMIAGIEADPTSVNVDFIPLSANVRSEMADIDGTQLTVRVNYQSSGMPGRDSDGDGVPDSEDNYPYDPTRRQLGGPVGRGRPYLVGEAGPELFVPGMNGFVVSNNNMQPKPGNMNVTINISGSAADSAKVGNSVRTALNEFWSDLKFEGVSW